MITSRLKQTREGFLDRHADARRWQARLFSGATCALWTAARPLMASTCRGLVLDAGSGRGAWKGLILESASAYESIDLAPRGGDRPTWVGDLTDMGQVPEVRYDTVVCHQVLEHVPRPAAAASELLRVLKPSGSLILSVPHLSRRHELPHDYFRFTPAGLTQLLADAGFTDVSVQTYGGLLAFLHHQVSFFFPGLLAGIPGLGTLAIGINAPLSWLSSRLDPFIDRGALMPLGVIATARRPS